MSKPLLRNFVLLMVSLLLVTGSTWSIAAAAPEAPPGAVTVSAPCKAGPGWMAVTISPKAEDGTNEVRVAARRLVDGSRWRVRIGDAETAPVFRPTAVDGRWVVKSTVTVAGDNSPFVEAVRTDQGHKRLTACFVIAFVPDHTVGGAGLCRGGFDVLVARRLADGTVVVRFLVALVKPDTSWHITMDAIGEGGTGITFDDRTNRNGTLNSRVEFRGGPADPRFRAVAVNEHGKTCKLHVNPRFSAPTVRGASARALLDDVGSDQSLG